MLCYIKCKMLNGWRIEMKSPHHTKIKVLYALQKKYNMPQLVWEDLQCKAATNAPLFTKDHSPNMSAVAACPQWRAE